MQLPHDKKCVAIVYHYEDGSAYQVTKENLEHYEDNLKSASMNHIIHSGGFDPVEWEKVEPQPIC